MWTILGHAPMLAALDRALASESPAHAWLFSGPEGVGKRATALEFAAALNCESVNRPCGECRPCRDTLAGRHPDVEIVEPGGLCDEPDHRDHADSRDLRICQIRRLERVISLSPYAGGRRVAIVDDADTLRVEAANAFLKTLEEPPAGTVIILLAEREERLPDTVLSRCQRLTFRPIDRQTILAALLAHEADPVQAEAIAGAAAGRLGWALRALEDPALLDERSVMLDQALRIAHASRFERFAWAKEAEARGPDAKERYQRELRVWEDWWRDVLLASSGTLKGAINGDRAAVLAEEGRLYAKADVVRFLRSLIQTREYLYANVDAQLALENLTMDLPPSSGQTGRGRTN
ncbi:MAG TPA: DNA polymerase III subunit delta' [Dehalococcoidia bacterium]|nr:DNA polymerase III subunit delta' [Dehalococcoidia bacterium]